MTKSATVLARIEPQVKEEAEAVFSDIGVSPSTAINVFYRQVIKQGGLPFEVTKKHPNIPVLDEMTETEIDKMLDKSTAEIKAGKTRPAAKVFAELHREFGF